MHSFKFVTVARQLARHGNVAHATSRISTVSSKIPRVMTNWTRIQRYSLSEGDSQPIVDLRNSLKSENHLAAWPQFQNLSPAEVSRLTEDDVGLMLSTFLKTDKVESILKSIRSAHGGEGLSLQDFNDIAQKYSQDWTFGECIAYLESMRKEGIQPDISTFEALVDTLIARGDPVGAKKIIEEEQPGELVPPTGKMYINLAGGFLRQGDPDACAQVLQEMVACEIKPDEESLVALLNELLSKGHEDLASEIANMMVGPEDAAPSFGSAGERP